MPTKVAIVEDDPRIRESLRELLNDSTGLRCVSAHGSAEDALRDLPGQAPDVVLMDINLPGMSGIEAVFRLREKVRDIPVLMLTVYEDADRVFEALKHGARGYLLKRTAPAKLIDAIHEARAGGAPMSPQIARKVVQHFHLLGPSPQAPDNLTPREQEILALLAQGRLYKEIADALGIGTETVRSHLSAIYRKLHVRSRTEAVVKHLGK